MPLISIAPALALTLALSASPAASAQTAPFAPLSALPFLNIPAYMGDWYQVAWSPNRFQKQSAIRSRLTQQGFDLARWQTHKHTPAAEAPR